MTATTALAPVALYRACAPDALPFATTAELDDGSAPFGQQRAIEAIRFGVEMRLPGHNLFVMGPAGTGRRSFVGDFLKQLSAGDPAPADWCYVNDFNDAARPRALALPAGVGKRLAQAVERCLVEVQAAVGAAFGSEEYRNRRQGIEREFEESQGRAFEQVQQAARERNIRIMQTPNGMVFAPVVNGAVLGPEEFEKLTAEQQATLQNAVEEVGKLFQETMQHTPERLRGARERIRQLDHEVADLAIRRLVAEVDAEFEAVPAAREYLEMMRADLTSHYELLREPEGQAAGMPLRLDLDGEEPGDSRVQRRYGINVLVSREPQDGAPVVIEERPSYGRLLGKIEHRARFGALTTDFKLIRAGALHQANGGYLVMNALRLLSEPFAWDALKETLRNGHIRIVPLEQAYGFASTVSLEPAPIPVKLKVILIGAPRLYYLLREMDPEFDDFFKVVAEFDDRTSRSDAAQLEFARLVAGAARKDALLPLVRDAVARVIEEAARWAEDADKLSTELRRAIDLVREADYWARKRGVAAIERADVEQAIERQAWRKGRISERIQEEILRDTLLIDTSGTRIGQINGLAVMAVGDQAFGKPSRISARVSLGGGTVIDIEREAELGGELHSKGVMILAGYIAARYAQWAPASFAATLAFEQSYGGVDGDSASSTELYALLSALAQVPLRQDLAVTGSVNQFGDVQAIGGVNHKIEGFFDVCAARGLTGSQGVLIPAANVKHLMLRPRVVEAVAAGRFHIHAVNSIDEGITLLTGMEAGTPDADGSYPEGSLNRRVVEQLASFAQARRQFGQGGAAAGEALT
ncbi:MAG: AAA family ATPase [Proteobacteria bacterium]|nr:AAA family ATPase [Pseudomonadota bacterium]